MSGVVASRLLGLNGEIHRLVFGHVIASPKSVEQVESEIPADRILDYLTLSLSGSSRSHLHSAKDLFVNR